MEQLEGLHSRGLWSPCVLRPLTLCLFSLFYLKLAIVLSVLAWYSSVHQGICKVQPTDHYFWQYAPTAAFTVLSALWSQVDYRCRLMMPWILLARGPQPADRSILLDYVSPNIISALVKSMRSRDGPIVLALSGTLLNRILIVLSTSLFSSASVTITNSAMPLKGGRTFSQSGFNTSLVSQLPIARVFGLEALNMSYPFGTSSNYATEIPPCINENSTRDNFSQVSVIYPLVDCEVAHVQSPLATMMTDIPGGVYNDSDGNIIKMYIGEQFMVTDPKGNTQSYPMLPYLIKPPYGSVKINANFSSKSCTSIQASASEVGDPLPFVDSSPHLNCTDNDYRFIFGFYPMSGLQTRSSEGAYLVCKPRQTLRRANMTYLYNNNPETGRWEIDVPIHEQDFEQYFDNVVARNIVDGFLTAISDTNKTDILQPLATGKASDWMYDAGQLKEIFPKLYQSAAVQIINTYLLAETDTGFEVTETVEEIRLQLHGYVLWITGLCLSLLAINSIALGFFTRHAVVSRDPGSITGVATILARSGGFLNATAISLVKTSKETFETQTFHTECVPSQGTTTEIFRICQITTASSTRPTSDEEYQLKLKWYCPVIIHSASRVFIIVATTIIIAFLQAIYDVSSRDQGFVSLEKAPYKEYAWRLVPSTLLVLFGLLFSAMDFELKTLVPLINLKKGQTSSGRSVDEKYHALLGLHGLWTATRKRQFCVMATFLGTSATQFLAIMSSGLFMDRDIINEKPIQLRQLNNFALDAFTDINRINYQEKGMVAATLVIEEGMDLPQWTYDSFVVPVMELAPAADYHENIDSIQMTVPAMRAVANCTEIYPSSINYSNSTYLVEVSFESLTDCGGDNHTSTWFQTTGVSGEFAFWGDRSGYLHHCPEYLVLSGDKHDISKDWKPLALHCSPYLESIDALIEVTYPGLLNVRTSRPSLNASTRVLASTAEIPGIGQNLLARYLTSKIPIINPSATGNSDQMSSTMSIKLSNVTVDGFFGEALRHRRTEISNLTTDINILRSAVEDIYPRVVAQVLNLNRAIFNDPIIHEGKARLRNQVRLVLNGPSVRALQALLAVMAFSTAATFTIGSLKQVVPHNPRSIAGLACLLAGSSMFDEEVIPPGSEWRRDKELRRLGLFKGLKFSMGWWSSSEGESGGSGEDERFGIDIGKAVWYGIEGKSRQ